MDECEGNGLGVVHRTAKHRAIAALRLFQCPFHLNNNSNKLDGVGSLACGPIQIHQGWGLDSDGGGG